jgi:hypothetical protein
MVIRRTGLKKKIKERGEPPSKTEEGIQLIR